MSKYRFNQCVAGTLPSAIRLLRQVTNITDYFYEIDLFERGWTPWLIAQFLPNHDGIRPDYLSPDYEVVIIGPEPAPTYNRDRVEQIESTQEFLDARKLSDKRRAAAARGVETKRRKTIQTATPMSSSPG